MDNFEQFYQSEAESTETNFIPKQPWYRKKPAIITIIVITVLVTGSVALNLKSRGSDAPEEVAGEKIYSVTATSIQDLLNQNTVLSTSGIVKAEREVDIIALTNGTLQSLDINIGDKVTINQQLATLFNNTSLTNLANAQAHLSNVQQAQNSTKRLANESVAQAEINVQRASESVDGAKISLKATEDNLANGIALQSINKNDTFSNAVITYASYLNTINNILNQINFIIKEDGNAQLPGIEKTLAATSVQSLINVKISYIKARDDYKKVQVINVATNNIVNSINQIVASFKLTLSALDDTINVLNNTVTSADFTASNLQTQKNNFTSLRNSLIISLTTAQSSLQNLSNIDSIQKRELDSLQNAVANAKSQVSLAQTALRNSIVSLQNAKEAKDQQLIGAKTSVDSSRGQLNLIQSQFSDLTLKSPIAGSITGKFVEVGTEVRAGQKIATVSQIDKVKIEFELSSSDIYKVQIGSPVIINKNVTGNITRINPSADPVTKKVKLEMYFDNTTARLIPQTFVDVKIPLNTNNINNSNAIMIPLKAVTITQTESFVFVVENNIAVKKSVITRTTEGSVVEITSGLVPSDVVIIEGNRVLEGGEKVAS